MYPYMGTTFWCGIFFVISGSLGLIARAHPGTAIIATLMVFNIIAAVCCVPLFVASIYIIDESSIRFVLLLIGLMQVVTATASSTMACKVSCCCCIPTVEDGIVYYTYNEERERHNPTAPSSGSPLQHPGYVAIPTNQIPLDALPQR